jgi:RNA polymerase sigma factor (sigma-70 family)
MPDRDRVTARLLAAGDPEGLRRLLADHAGKVRAVLHKEFENVLDASEIDDAVAQASVRVWRQGRKFEAAKGTLRAWFYVIARNCGLRILANKRGRAGLSFVDDLDLHPQAVATVPDTETQARQKFLRDLYQCIDELPALQRAVVLADLAAGGTAATEDLVAEMKTTSNSIYVSRTNARKSLRAALLGLGYQFGEEAAGSGVGAEVTT